MKKPYEAPRLRELSAGEARLVRMLLILRRMNERATAYLIAHVGDVRELWNEFREAFRS